MPHGRHNKQEPLSDSLHSAHSLALSDRLEFRGNGETEREHYSSREEGGNDPPGRRSYSFSGRSNTSQSTRETNTLLSLAVRLRTKTKEEKRICKAAEVYMIMKGKRKKCVSSRDLVLFLVKEKIIHIKAN